LTFLFQGKLFTWAEVFSFSFNFNVDFWCKTRIELCSANAWRWKSFRLIIIEWFCWFNNEFGVDVINSSDWTIEMDWSFVVIVSEGDSFNIGLYRENLVEDIDEFRLSEFDWRRNCFRFLRKYKNPPILIDKNTTTKTTTKSQNKLHQWNEYSQLILPNIPISFRKCFEIHCYKYNNRNKNVLSFSIQYTAHALRDSWYSFIVYWLDF